MARQPRFQVLAHLSSLAVGKIKRFAPTVAAEGCGLKKRSITGVIAFISGTAKAASG